MRRPLVNIVPLVLAAGLVAALASSAAAQVPPHAPLRLAVSPPGFSPNGDGRLDQVTITVSSDQSATVRIEVLDRAGTTIHSWTRPVAPDAPATVTWDGKVAGKTVPDGAYTVRGRGETEIDPVDEARATLTVDTLEPEARWGGGSPLLTRHDRVTFAFRVSDASSPLHVRLDIDNGHGVIGSTEATIRSGEGRIAWRARTPNGKPLVPGTYFATLSVRDDVGNQTGLARTPWRVQTPSRARVVTNVPGSGRRVALTIDDCHFAGAWARMLRTLRERKATATFFCPGKQMLTYPALVRRTIREGHEIGSHAWDHALLPALSQTQVISRLRADANALWRVARRTTAPYFRPPYGAYDRSVIDAAGLTGHPRVVMWDVDTRDWTRPGVRAITQAAVRQAQPGSIVLLHTIEQSAAALPGIISGLRARGLEPVGLGELFEAKRSR